jgi:hypothetical protein
MLKMAVSDVNIKNQKVIENPFNEQSTIISAKQLDVDRFATYSSKTYGKLGFDPFKDNNKNYNAKTHWSEDVGRAMTGMFKLAGVGFQDTFGFGLTAGSDSSKNFENVMKNYSSTRGGYTQFWANTALSSGYTVGIIGAIAAEEIGLALTTGGLGNIGTSGLVGIQATRAFNNLGKATRSAEYIERIQQAGHVDEAAKFFSMKGLGQNLGKLGQKLNPVGEIADFARKSKLDEFSEFNSLQKVSLGAGAIARDARKLYMTHSESKLEADLAKSDFIEKQIQKARLSSPTGELDQNAINQIQTDGANVYNSTYMGNLGLIYATNAITFDNMFKSMRYSNKMFSIPGKMTTALGKDGLVVKAVKGFSGKRALAAGKKAIVDFSVKDSAKNLTRYIGKNYKVAGANLIKKGLSNSMEGVQELGQDVVSNSVQSYYGRNHAGQQVRGGFLENMWQAASDMSFSDVGDAIGGTMNEEGLSTFGSGFFMGTLAAPFGGGIGLLQKQIVGGGARNKAQYLFNRQEFIKKQKTEYKKSLAKAKELTANFNAQLGSFLDHTSNPLVTQSEFQEQILDAAQKGDKKVFEDKKHDSFQQGLKSMLKNNSEGMFTDFLEHMVDKFTPEQMNQAMGRNDITADNVASYKTKLQTKVATIKSLRKQYDQINEQVVPPIRQSDIDRLDESDPEQRKQKLDLIIYKKAWENLKDELLFNKGKITNKAQRLIELEKELSKESGLSATEVQSFISKKGLNTEIQILQTQVEANKNLNLKGEDAKNAKIAEFKLEALQNYQTALTAVEKAESADETSADEIEDAYSDLFEAYHEYRSINPEYGMFYGKEESEEVKRAISRKSFDSIVDYLDLNTESQALQDVVNTLVDPTSAKMWVDRNAEMMTDLDKNKEKHIANQLYAFQEKAASSEMLTQLQEAGIFFDLNELDDLVGKGIMPSEIYNIESNKAGSKEEYQKAQEIISQFYKKLTGKTITQDKSGGSKRSLRYKEDKRTVKGLLRQYGIKLGKEIDLSDPVQLERMLRKLKSSTFLTQIDKALLDKVSDSMPTIMFVDNAEFPISVNEDGVFVIDVRYAGSDYKNVAVNFETLVLSALTQAKLNDNLEENEDLKTEVENLMQQAKDAFGKKYPNLDMDKISMFSSAAEFLSESLNNTAFQSFLGNVTDTVSGNKESLWKTLMAKIMQAFNKTFEKSVLQRAVSLSNMALDPSITDNIDEKVDDVVLSDEIEKLQKETEKLKEDKKAVQNDKNKDLDEQSGIGDPQTKREKRISVLNTLIKLNEFKINELKSKREDSAVVEEEELEPVSSVEKNGYKLMEVLPGTWQVTGNGEVKAFDTKQEAEDYFNEKSKPPKQKVKQTVKEKVKRTIEVGNTEFLENANERPDLFGDFLHPEVVSSDRLAVAEWTQKIIDLGKELDDARITNWVYGNVRAQVDGRLVIDVTAEVPVFVKKALKNKKANPKVAQLQKEIGDLDAKIQQLSAQKKTPTAKEKASSINTNATRNDVEALRKIYDSSYQTPVRSTFNYEARQELEAEAKKNKSVFGKLKVVTREEVEKRGFENYVKAVQSTSDTSNTTELNYTVADGLSGWSIKNRSTNATKDIVNTDSHPDYRQEYTGKRNQNWAEFDEGYTNQGKRVVNIKVPVRTDEDTNRPSVYFSFTLELPEGVTAESVANPIIEKLKQFNGKASTKELTPIVVQQATEILKAGPTNKKTVTLAQMPVLETAVNTEKVMGKAIHIPMSVYEEAYANDKANKGTQPLVQLLARGGYTVKELDDLLPDWKEKVYAINNPEQSQEKETVDKEIEATLKERNALQDQLNAEEQDIIEEGEETVQQGTKKVKFLMYKSTGKGSTALSAGEWVPLLAIGIHPSGNEWFVKAMYEGQDPKFNKYGSSVFADIDKDLKAEEANLFTGIRSSQEIEEEVETEIEVEIDAPEEDVVDEVQTEEQDLIDAETKLKTEINQKRELLKRVNEQIASTRKIQLRKRMQLDAQKSKLLFELKDLQEEYDAKFGDEAAIVPTATIVTETPVEEEVNMDNTLVITERTPFASLPEELQDRLLEQYRMDVAANSVGAIRAKYKKEIKQLETLNRAISQAPEEEVDALDEQFGQVFDALVAAVGPGFNIRLNEQAKIEIGTVKTNTEASEAEIEVIQKKMANDISFLRTIIEYNKSQEPEEFVPAPAPQATVELTEEEVAALNASEIERGKQLKQQRLDQQKEEARARSRARKQAIVPITSMEREQIAELLQKVLKSDYDILTAADLTYLVDNLLNDSKTFRFRISDALAFVSKKKMQLEQDSQIEVVNEAFADELENLEPDARAEAVLGYQKDIFEELSDNSTVYNYDFLSKFAKSKEPIGVSYDGSKFTFTLRPVDLKALALYNKDLFKKPLSTKEDEQALLINIHKILEKAKAVAKDYKKNLKFTGTPQEIEDKAVELFFDLMKKGILLPAVVTAVNQAFYNSGAKLTIVRSNALSGSMYTLEERESLANRFNTAQDSESIEFESEDDFRNFIGTEGAEEAFANLEGFNNSFEFKIITGQLDLASTTYDSLTPGQKLLYDQAEAEGLYDGTNAEIANDAANQEIEIPESFDKPLDSFDEAVQELKAKETAVDKKEAELTEELRRMGDTFPFVASLISQIEAIENDKNLKLFLAAFRIINSELFNPFKQPQKNYVNDRLMNRLRTGAFVGQSVLIDDIPMQIFSYNMADKTVDLVDISTGEVQTLPMEQLFKSTDVFEEGQEYTKLNLDTVVNDQEIAYIKEAYQDIFNNFTASVAEFEKLENANLNSQVLEQLTKCK